MREGPASAVFWHHSQVGTRRAAVQHTSGEPAGPHGTLEFEGVVGVGGDDRGVVHFAP